MNGVVPRGRHLCCFSSHWAYEFSSEGLLLTAKQVYQRVVRCSKNLMTPCLRVTQAKMNLFFSSRSSCRPTASVGCGKGRDPELPGALVGSGSERGSSLTGCRKAEDGKSWAEGEPERGWLAIAHMSQHACCSGQGLSWQQRQGNFRCRIPQRLKGTVCGVEGRRWRPCFRNVCGQHAT